jgi:hypothetical protein
VKSFRTALFVLLIAVSADATIGVTPEIGIVDPIRAPLDNEQSSPVIATDGDEFLVFWTNFNYVNVAGVNVAHVAGDGRLLSSRLAVPHTSGEQLSATWTGSVYLATWKDSAKAALFFATFSKTGDLLSGPIAIVGGMVGTLPGALASNGHRALLLYTEAGSPGLKAAIFDADGGLIKTNVAIPLATSFPAITSDGEEFALVWRTAEADPPSSGLPIQDIHLLRVDEDGAAIGSPIDIGSVASNRDFGLAFGDGRYAIAAFEAHVIKPGYTQSRLVRFSVDARRGSIIRLPAVENLNAQNLSLFWSGSMFVAAWVSVPPPPLPSPTPVTVMTLAFSGADESVAPTPVSLWTGIPAGWVVSMVSNGHHALAAWSQSIGTGGGGSEIYGTLFDAAASSAATGDAPTLFSFGWSRQFSPAMATSTTGSLIVWIEDGNATGRLLGMRTDATGALIDVVPFEIATGLSHNTPPAVVFTGDRYFVAWEQADYSSVSTRTVGRDGSLGLPISLGPGWGVAAASNGSETLVVFTERGAATDLVGYRFDASGKQIDTSPLVISDGFLPRVASNGTDFFVAWNEGSDYTYLFTPPNLVDVLGARVSAAGAVDAAPLPIATGPRDQRLFAVASDGRDYLIAYQLDQYQSAVIATKRVLREGQLDGTTAAGDGTIIAHGEPYGISLSGDATGYWSAYWQSNGTGNVLHLDKRGDPTSPAVRVGAALSSAALGRLPRGAVRILYARAIDYGEFTGTSMIFFRFVADDLGLRWRAARH